MEINNPQQQLSQIHQSHAHPAEAVSVGEWILTMLVMVVPLVNLVMLFVWGFGGKTKPSKANWSRASLLWMLIGITIVVLFSEIFLNLFADLAGEPG